MIHVIHVIIGLNVGGAELMLKRLVESHQDNPSYCHSVVSLTFIGKVGLQLQENGIDVQALSMRSPLDIPRILWQLVRIIRTKRPDIVQTWMYHADLLGGLAARLAGNRHVLWGVRTTDLAVKGSKATKIVRYVCARLSSWLPNTIIFAADASCRLHLALGYDSSRVAMVPNGFNVAQLVATDVQKNTLRQQCGFDINAVVVGSLGRFHTDKDHANFIRAAGLLASQFSDVRFLLIGHDLEMSNLELVSWIAATGYADRFVLLGQRVDVPICLSAMDIFCLHSRTEGFPNVIGEAMAMGLPCVATNVGDTALLIADTGVIVPKEDSVALMQGLKKLLEITPEARMALGQKAKMRIYSEFTMDRCRKRFEVIYQRVLNEEHS